MKPGVCTLCLAALLGGLRPGGVWAEQTALVDPTRPLIFVEVGEASESEKAYEQGAQRLTMVRLAAGNAWAVLGGITVRTGDRVGNETVVTINATGVVLEDAAGARRTVGFGALTRDTGLSPRRRYTNRDIE